MGGEVLLQHVELPRDAIRVALSMLWTRFENARRQTDPPPSAPTDETVTLLARLGQLRDAGVLTDEEFSAKKAELLGRL